MNHLQFTESLNWPKAFRSRLEAWEAFLVPYYFAFSGLRMIFLKILAFEENFPSKLLRLSLTFVLEIYFQFRYCAKLRWIFVFVCYWNSFFFLLFVCKRCGCELLYEYFQFFYSSRCRWNAALSSAGQFNY